MTRDRAHKKAIRARMAARGEPYSVAARKLADPEQPAEPEQPADPDVGQVGEAGQAPDAAALGDVIARAAATLAAASARIEFRRDLALLNPPAPRRPGPIGRLVGKAARAAWDLVLPGADPRSLIDAFAHSAATGLAEPAAGRYMIDYGGYAAVYVDGQRFSGPSGTAVKASSLDRTASEAPDPMTLLRLPRDATDARYAGDETLRGTPCRVVTVAAPGPGELTVWVDDEHIRRIRCVERVSKGSRTSALELWDFGVPVDSLDWSRFPGVRVRDR